MSNKTLQTDEIVDNNLSKDTVNAPLLSDEVDKKGTQALPNLMSNPEQAESLADKGKVLSPGQMVLKRFFRSKLSVIGLALLAFLFLFAIFGPLLRFISCIPVYDEEQFFGNADRVFGYLYNHAIDGGYNFYFFTYTDPPLAVLHQPRPGNILGTDRQGRDVFSRLMFGGRISLLLAFAVVFASTIIGVIMGGLAGYFGKWTDQVIMRVVDIFFCIPTLPLLLIVGASMDSIGVDDQIRIVVLGAMLVLFNWAGTARLVRGQILMLREQEFMLAAEAMGLSVPRRIFKHLVPNVLPQLIVSMTLSLGGVILSEATLTFLGFGIQPPLAAWGTMIGELTDFNVLQNHFHLWGPPGLLIMMAVLGFNFVGDGLRDAFDPKMKR